MSSPTPTPSPEPWNQTLLHNVVGQESSWFWTMIQAVVVAVTLYLIWRQIRLQRLANMLTALHVIDARWNSQKMVGYRKSVCANPFDTNVGLTDAHDHVLVFFEDIGMQVKLGVLDPTIVWDTYSLYIEFYWPILKGKIEEQWNKGDKSIYENFKSLVQKMASISAKRKTRWEKTHDEIQLFANSEASREPEEE